MKHPPLLSGGAMLVWIAAHLLCSSARAADGTWIDVSTGPNLWSNALMWNGGVIADGAGSSAFFTSNITGASTVTLDSSRNLTNLTFSDNGASGSPWVLGSTGGAVLTLGDGTTNGISTFQVLTNTTISASLGGANLLLKRGEGNLTLGAGNSYTGGTILSQGTLTLGAPTAAGNGTITLGDASTGTSNLSLLFAPTANTQTVANPLVVSNLGTGTVTIGSASTTFTNVSYSGAVTLNRATTLVAGSTDRTNFNGVISGNVGTLTIAGGARMVFTGSAKTFLGDVTISGTGTNLQVGVATSSATDQIPNTANVTVGAGAAFRLSSLSEEFGGLFGSGTVNSNAAPAGGVVIVGSFNQSGTFSGAIGSGGTGLGLTKVGTGTQVLSGAGTFTGITSVNGGTLTLSFGTVTSNILGSASPLTLGGGTLSLVGTGTQTVGGLTTTAGTRGRILMEANQTLTLGALTAAGAGSALNFNLSAGGGNGATVGASLVTLTGQTAGSSVRPGFTVTDAGGTGFATVNAGNQIIRLTGSTLLPATGATSTTDYQINNNAGGTTAAGSSTLTLSASASARTIAIAPVATNGVLTLNSGVILSNNGWLFAGTGTATYQITGSAGGAGLRSVAADEALIFSNYQAGTVTINSPILANGANSVTFTGPGTTVLGAASTYTGTTFVTEGTLNLNTGGGTGAIRGALTISPGATVNVSVTNGLGTTQNTRVGAVNINGGTLNLANTGTNSVTSQTITLTGGTITGIAGSRFDFRNNGAGDTNLTTTASSVTSTISVTTLGTSGGSTVITTARGNTPSGIDLSILSVLVDNAGGGGSGGNNLHNLTKAGAGALFLGGANTYTGLTAVNAGTLIIGNTSALGGLAALPTNGANGTTVASGAVLDLNGQGGITESITLSGTGIGGTGALINSSTTAASINSGLVGITQQTNTPGPVLTVTVTGGGGSGATVTSSFGVSTGSFAVNSGTTLYSAAPTVTISGGGGSGASATAILDASGLVTGIDVTNAGSGYTTAPTISFSSGTVLTAGTNPTGTGNAANFTLVSHTITATGSGFTSAPTLNYSGGNFTATAQLAGIVLAGDSSIGGAGNITLNGIISESGGTPRALTKVGANTLTLGNTNTYTGATFVNAGRLALASNGTTGTGAITVRSNGTLLGTGLVRGSSFTAQSGSTVHAGNGTAQADYGTLSFTPATGSGAFDFQSGSKVVLGINPLGSGDLLDFDGLLNGALSFQGDLQVTAVGYAPVTTQTFKLLDWSNLTTTSFASRYSAGSYGGFLLGNGDDNLGFDLPDIASSGYAWDISQFIINGSISVVVVPEPTRFVLLIGGLLVLLKRRQRVHC